MAADTIFALSSGRPPAAIAVVRISGPGAKDALLKLAGAIPPERKASLASLRDPTTKQAIDNALVFRFDGPRSATGEDVVELHLHGGRAVISAAEQALLTVDGLRPAEPGEFTRRAFENGRIDLTEAEGLADLLQAETQSQRLAALALAGGALVQRISQWEGRLLSIAAQVEAILDFSDEGDVEEGSSPWREQARDLADELDAELAKPGAERLRDGIRVVIAGPPNAGKSTLLNALAGREAAITSDLPGTTRDVVETPVAIHGVPFLFADTAGLRRSDDRIEAIGVERAQQELARADLILWLGEPSQCPAPDRSLLVRSKADLRTGGSELADMLDVSPVTGVGMRSLVDALVERSRSLLPAEGEVALNRRHRAGLASVSSAVGDAAGSDDLLIVAELLRQARAALDTITGRAGVEEMLDSLFGGFCIGK